MQGDTPIAEERLRLASVTEEAKRIRMSRAWLLREARAGRLRHFKVGTRVLLDPRDVDARIATYEIPAS